MDLSILNNSQKDAVLTTEGAVMVMAGAGSGKTRVLTYRIAYLISELGIDPTNILAVTFTNKAAREMKERVEKLLEIDAKNLWISTFHSFCARFLRKEIKILQKYKNDFVIIDDDDSLKILKEVMKDNAYSLTPKEAIRYISIAKNRETLPEMDSYELKEFETIFDAYQSNLVKENLLDFDDLILLTVEILEKYDHIKEKYQNLFSYIMIDEFQDTNKLQYTLVNLLTTKNIFIVGDVNQSIYSFRGARVENVTKFIVLYQPKIIKLEKNYRSTSNILDIANDVICKNQSFADMHLYTDNGEGEKAELFYADSNYGEVLHIIGKIKKLVREGYQYKDMAILYRVNSLSHNFESEFVKAQIPYVIYGGVGYFERKEVKDIIAYLRLLINSDDDFSFKRIVNVPKRKIGDKVVNALIDCATKNNCSLYQAIDYLGNTLLFDFKKMIEKLKETLEKETLVNLIDVILDRTGYMKMLEDNDEEDRIDNVKELKSIMKDVMESYEGTNAEKLNAFLMDLALKTDVDNTKEDDNKIKLMSFHQSKGLEYKVVFMPAMEQGIFPSYMCMHSTSEMEEERRICYVGITRAKEKLFLSMAEVRRMYGKDNRGVLSEFVKLIKKERLIEAGLHAAPSNPTNFNPSKYVKETPVRRADALYKAGDKIMHKVFGKGIVIKYENEKITVAFSQEFGVKVLLASHPSITKI